ncbi:hypothetical protein SPRG_15636 [Saprolegnia parasitica CBS 223.65]|uniref:Uncharacterized protein n=1 Tax=Saprolegnia parasitica (strain CBS 223.65) TaxID=695850 RepID=A0A067BLZ5_SAPPC|nr:hypothetical protein SPRG_15636 [Saprolegnia parasitica CBS 223.65]KDO19193.1 hypothetical protein SPRG_15636 [Saprolegnia parasitica CBS 223.65]|eukprot:XP_012210093.1 hypothetical protein SPRG_15636 [Saprolegnia parasitica CBS 223.65]
MLKPLTAYVSEHFPWAGTLSPPTEYANYSAFSNSELALKRALYTNATLPDGKSYYVDNAKNAQVGRGLLRLGQPPMPVTTCSSSLLPGLPGLIFYSDRIIEMLCNAATAPNASAVDWATQGSCFQSQFLSFSLGHSCVWLVSGDAINSGSVDAAAMTVYFVYNESRFAVWVWLKFGYRILVTLFVWYRLWTQYYKHVIDLERCLRVRGHRETLPHPASWSYELVLGDPTAIVLMDPWVATLYFFDIWLSVTNLSVAILQVGQSGSTEHLVRSIWYLSRTIWFAFWGLCLASYGLKRWHKEHLFATIDPTLLSLAVMVYGPLLTWTSAHLPPFTRFYQWTLTFGIPHIARNEAIEATLACIVYVGSIASLPLLYGLVTPALRRVAPLRFKSVHARRDYASFRYNHIKNRILLSIFQRRQPRDKAIGGTVHAVMDKHPRLRRTPTISTRATDCFVTCYCDGQPQEQLRVSLLCDLDMRNDDDDMVIHSSDVQSEFVVHILREAPLAMQQVIGSGPAVTTSYPYVLHRARTPSSWCL